MEFHVSMNILCSVFWIHSFWSFALLNAHAQLSESDRVVHLVTGSVEIYVLSSSVWFLRLNVTNTEGDI